MAFMRVRLHQLMLRDLRAQIARRPLPAGAADQVRWRGKFKQRNGNPFLIRYGSALIS